MSHLSLLPFPATNAHLPEAVEQTLRGLNGPQRDPQNSLYQLATPLDRGKYNACPSCGVSFNIFRRRNNCINCGLVVCSSCLDSKWYLPKYGIKQAVMCCTMCDRNLHMSIRSKDDLKNCSVRELRAYLQMYGLYNPSSMIEKSDLVMSVYNHSPMPQANETIYRNSLPQPSSASPTGSRRQTRRQGSSNSLDNMLSEFGDEVNRGVGNIGQAIAGMFDSPSTTGNRGRQQTGAQTYSRATANSNTNGPSNARRQPQWPYSAQDLRNAYTRPAPPAPTTTVQIPKLRDMARDNTDVGGLSIKVLKQLLAKNHVDYSGIVEKQELVLLVKRLITNTKLEMEQEEAAEAQRTSSGGDNKQKQQQQGQQSSSSNADDNLCKICWENATNSVFLNCGHMCTCLECGEMIVESDKRECPICREYIARIVHVFRA